MIHINGTSVELFDLRVEEFGGQQWRISSESADTYVTGTLVNDVVATMLNEQPATPAHYIVSLPPAYGGLLALQKPEFHHAIRHGWAAYSPELGMINVPNVPFVRPDYFFCWRTTVRISLSISMVNVEPVSAGW